MSLTVVIVGALLAWQKVISGDAWLTLVLGLLIPSPLERKPPTGGTGLPAGVGVALVLLRLVGIGFAVWAMAVRA